MHEQHCYSPDIEEVKQIELVNHLKRGNDINTERGQDYILLRDRTLSRIEHLSNVLRMKTILEIKNGKYIMTEEFKNVWMNRKSYWSQMQREKTPETPNEPSPTQTFVNLSEDDERPQFKRFPMSPSPDTSKQQRDKDLYDASEDEGPRPKKAPPVTPRKSGEAGLPSEISEQCPTTKNRAQNSIMSFFCRAAAERPVISLEEDESPSIKRQKMTLPNGSFTARPVIEKPVETARQFENTRKRRLLAEDTVADELMSRVSSVSLALRASVEKPAQTLPSITEDDAREDSITTEHVKLGNVSLAPSMYTNSVDPFLGTPQITNNVCSAVSTTENKSSI
jgi:hypothetical protein